MPEESSPEKTPLAPTWQQKELPFLSAEEFAEFISIKEDQVKLSYIFSKTREAIESDSPAIEIIHGFISARKVIDSIADKNPVQGIDAERQYENFREEFNVQVFVLNEGRADEKLMSLPISKVIQHFKTEREEGDAKESRRRTIRRVRMPNPRRKSPEEVAQAWTEAGVQQLEHEAEIENEKKHARRRVRAERENEEHPGLVNSQEMPLRAALLRLEERRKDYAEKLRDSGVAKIHYALAARSWMFARDVIEKRKKSGPAERMSGTLNVATVLGVITLGAVLSSKTLREQLSSALHHFGTPDASQVPLEHVVPQVVDGPEIVQHVPGPEVAPTPAVAAPETVVHPAMPGSLPSVEISDVISQGGFDRLVELPDLQAGKLDQLPIRAQHQLANVLTEVFKENSDFWHRLVPEGKRPGIFPDVGHINLNVLTDSDIARAIDQKIQEGRNWSTYTLARRLPEGGFETLMKGAQ